MSLFLLQVCTKSRYADLMWHILLFLGLASAAFADSPSQPKLQNWGEWQEARSLYDAGKVEQALQMFQSHPTEDASYFYNLGTLFFQSGKAGQAVAYLEKANHIGAHDPDIQHNLRIARNELGRIIGVDNLDPASSWTEVISDRVPMDEIRGTLGLLAFILTLVWARKYWKCKDLKQTFLEPAGFFTVLAFGITGMLYGIELSSRSTPPAVLVDRQVVRSGPGDTYIEIGKLDAGVKLRLMGPVAQSAKPNENWYQVRFTSDGIGWVPASSLLLL